MPKIARIHAREIFDSRGIPTIETQVILDSGISQRASAPSGPGSGKYEGVELRDNDPSRFKGQGVTKAVELVNTEITTKLTGMEITAQGQIDKILVDMDGTPNKARLGVNSIMTVSFAVAKAAAVASHQYTFTYINQLMKAAVPNTPLKLPAPVFNIINGGKHGAGNLDFQEYHVVPGTSKTYVEALRIGIDVYQAVKQVLINRNAVYSIGDEGGFAPNLYTNIDALEALTEAIKTTPYKVGMDVFLGLDIAAAHFQTEDGYKIKDRPVALKSEEFIDYLNDLNRDYHLLLLEDPLGEEDWEGWGMLTETLRSSLVIVGDDLLATNPLRLKQAIEKRACTAILIKPNQVGTLSETLQLIQMARNGEFKVIISHRSGETNDDVLSDLAVAVGAEYVKFGAPSRGERITKYNRLLEIASLFKPA